MLSYERKKDSMKARKSSHDYSTLQSFCRKFLLWRRFKVKDPLHVHATVLLAAPRLFSTHAHTVPHAGASLILQDSPVTKLPCFGSAWPLCTSPTPQSHLGCVIKYPAFFGPSIFSPTSPHALALVRDQ